MKLRQYVVQRLAASILEARVPAVTDLTTELEEGPRRQQVKPGPFVVARRKQNTLTTEGTVIIDSSSSSYGLLLHASLLTRVSFFLLLN